MSCLVVYCPWWEANYLPSQSPSDSFWIYYPTLLSSILPVLFNTAHMVKYPDKYSCRRRLIPALRPPLQKEVLCRGITAEFSSLEYISEKAKDIEDSSWYNLGSRLANNISNITPTVCRPTVKTLKLMFHQNQCFIKHNKHMGSHRETLNQYLIRKQLQKQITVSLMYQVVWEHLWKKVKFIATNVDKKATLNHNVPNLRANSEFPERKSRTSSKKMRNHQKHQQIC